MMRNDRFGLLLLVVGAVVCTAGCSKKPSSGPLQIINEYSDGMVRIIRSNLSDCDRAVGEAQAYADRNQAAIVEASLALVEMMLRMSKEELEAFEAERYKDREGAAKEWIMVVEEIGKKCPNHYERLMGLVTNKDLLRNPQLLDPEAQQGKP